MPTWIWVNMAKGRRAKVRLHEIYGIACAGKFTTALRFATDNGVRTIVSTDYLRDTARRFLMWAGSSLTRSGGM